MSQRKDVAPAGAGPNGGAGVRVGPLQGLPGVMRELGRDPEPVFRSAGFETAQFDDPDRVVSFLAASRLLARCVDATGCGQLGLLLGQRAAPSSLGLAGYLLRTAPDVGTALSDLVRHLELHDQGGVPTLEVRGGIALFGYAIQQPGAEARDQIYDLSLVMICNILRGLCGADWNPAEVLACRPPPPDASPYRRFFRAPLRFGAEQSAIVFGAQWLNQSAPAADPLLHRHLRREAELQHWLVEGNLAAALRRVLRGLLVNKQCSAPQAACRLRLHPRTLYRRLRAQGTSFQREFDAIRYAVAREFLADTAMPLAKIAEALDYADTTAFSRAFKRWSGVTPARWRVGGPEA